MSKLSDGWVALFRMAEREDRKRRRQERPSLAFAWLSAAWTGLVTICIVLTALGIVAVAVVEAVELLWGSR